MDLGRRSIETEKNILVNGKTARRTDTAYLLQKIKKFSIVVNGKKGNKFRKKVFLKNK